MIWVMIFMGIALSIIRANGWIIVPTFCLVFCWGISIVCAVIHCYVTSLKEKVINELNSAAKKDGRCPVCGREGRADHD